MNTEVLPEEKTITTTSLKPLEDRVIIKPDQAPDTINGIILPDSHKEKHKPHRGTVLAVGPGKLSDASAIQFKMLVALQFLCWCANKLTLGAFKIPEELVDIKPEPMPLKVGDRILYGHYAGTEAEDPKTKEKVLIMRVSDCFCFE